MLSEHEGNPLMQAQDLAHFLGAEKGILYSILLHQAGVTSPLQDTLLVEKSPVEQTSVLLHLILSYKLRLLSFPLLLGPKKGRNVSGKCLLLQLI